jgi:hypothetical protein
VTNAISKWQSFWQPFLRWPPKCVKFRSAPISTKIDGRKSSKYRFSLKLTNFELKLEIPNIMLLCKFEINWSTNKNLKWFFMH